MTKWIPPSQRRSLVKLVGLKEPGEALFEAIGAPETRIFNKVKYHLLYPTKFGIPQGSAFYQEDIYKSSGFKVRIVKWHDDRYVVYLWHKDLGSPDFRKS
jgi:hypothetical protein